MMHQHPNIISLHQSAMIAPVSGKVDELARFEHWEIPTNLYYTPEEVEMRHGIAQKTLANWRCEGKHLIFHKAGSKVSYPFYGKRSLSLFLKASSKTSTSTEVNA